MFVVCVTFQIKPGAWDDFLVLMQMQARNSVTLEPGCLRFDVCHNEGGRAEVFLYEVYADESAFKTHLQSDHFKRFDAEVAPLVAAKTVQTFDRLYCG